MFRWIVVGHERRELLVRSMVKSWRGGHAVIHDVQLRGRHQPRWLAVASAEGARSRREPRWPDLLTAWTEINDDALFPEAEAPVVAEEVSALGADAFVAHAGPGFEQVTVGWYAKGALASYEHVGSATVSWTPEEGLGRPFDGTPAQLAARGYKKLAALVGADDHENVADRIAQTNRVMGELLISRAFYRFLDVDPPEVDELAGIIAKSRTHRWALPA